MPVIIKKQLNYAATWTYHDVVCFTGNSVIKRDGTLTMGAGAAKAFLLAHPDSNRKFAEMIQAKPERLTAFVDFGIHYGGWVKTKHHWNSRSTPELVESSLTALNNIAIFRPSLLFHCNMPGIGHGGLPLELVTTLVNRLPAPNIYFYL